jgi:hypothetical protein
MTISVKNKGGGGHVKIKGTGGGVRVKSPAAQLEAPRVWSNYLLAWYRADDVELVYGTYVTRVNDKSGNGRHLGQDQGAYYYPTIETNSGGGGGGGGAVFNGQPTWRFSGNPQHLTASVWNLDGASGVGYTIFSVFASRAAGGSKAIWDLSENQTTNKYGLAGYDEGGTGIVRSSTTATLTFSQPSINVPLVFTTNWRTGSNNMCQAWIDGHSVSGPATVAYLYDNPSYLRLGSLWQNVWWHNSSQAEFLMFSGTLPTAARKDIEAYLGSRYGITVGAILNPYCTEDPYPATGVAAGGLSIGGSVTLDGELTTSSPWSRHRSGGHECYANYFVLAGLEAGKTYQIHVYGTSGFDTFMYLLGGPCSTDSVLTYNDDDGGGLSSQINFTPTTTGDYSVEATSYYGYRTGNISVTVTRTA